MALKSSDHKQESKFERPAPLDPGTYPARVVQVISLGLQKQQPFKGEEKPPKHEIYVTYEMLDEFLKDEGGEDIEDKPRWLSERFTMNSLESDMAKSTKRYLALDPSNEFDGDWAQLIGAPCMVTVVQNVSKKDKDVVYNNIASVQTMRPKEAAKAADLRNPGKVFDVDEPDLETFLALPKWLQETIQENLEYEGSMLEEALDAHTKGEAKTEKKAKTEKRKPVDDVEEHEEPDGEDEENW